MSVLLHDLSGRSVGVITTKLSTEIVDAFFASIPGSVKMHIPFGDSSMEHAQKFNPAVVMNVDTMKNLELDFLFCLGQDAVGLEDAMSDATILVTENGIFRYGY